MQTENNPKKHILSDHKKIGSTFIAPFSQLGITETTWPNSLPELIWMGLLNDQCGYKRGVEISTEMAKAAYDINPGGTKINFGEISSYKSLSLDEQKRLLNTTIVKGALGELKHSLEPLNVLYPDSPLGFLGLPEAGTEKKALISMMDRVVSDNLNKRKKPAMFLQANLVYIGGICGFIHFSTKVMPPNLNSLAQYPDTEESKKTASSVRALSLSLIRNSEASDWAKYFWNQGLKIDPCRAMRSEDA